MKAIFYIQGIIAILCFAIVVKVDFFTRPIGNFEGERGNLEALIAKDSHLDPSYPSLSALHYFISALYQADRFSYFVVLVACTTLFFCSIIGLVLISRRQAS